MSDVDEWLGLPEKWEADALCVQVDPELFFPLRGQPAREAQRVCAHCPVVEECLDRALSFDGEVWGVWGGTTARERRRMRKVAAA